MRRAVGMVVALALLAGLAGCGGSPAPVGPPAKAVLRMGVLTPAGLSPGPGASAAAAVGVAQVAAYLSQQIGKPVTGAVVGSVAELLAGVRSGTYDIAWMGALAYVAAGPRVADVVVRTPSVGSIIVCNPLAGVAELRDGGDWSALRGKSFAFGDAASLPATLWPQYYMKRNHLDVAHDLVPAPVVPNPTAIALAVYNNTSACGAMYEDARVGAARIAPDIVAKTRVVFVAPQPIPGDPVVVRHGLNRGQADRVRRALVRLGTDPAMRGALAAGFGAAGLDPATDRDYDPVRRVVAAVNPGVLALVGG